MKSITIYTDGSSKVIDEVRCSGWGFYGITEEGEEIDGFGGAGKNVSHNVAELEAAVNAIQYAIDSGYDDIKLLLDSEYVIQCMNRIDIAEEAGYDNIKNAEYRKKLFDLRSITNEKNISVIFNWNKGHSGIPGNERADRLAKRGVLAEKENMVVPCIMSNKGKQEKSDTEEDFIHPMLTGKFWFFKSNSKDKVGGRYFYGTATFEEYKKDKKDKKDALKYAGKQEPDNHYSFVLSKEPANCIENIRKLFNESLNKQTVPILANLLNINKKSNWVELNNRFKTFVNLKNGLLLNPEKELLGRVVDPPLLVWRMNDYFDKGYFLLQKFEENSSDIHITPCTEYFISSNEKGKQELSKQFPPTAKTMLINNVTLPNGLTTNTILTLGIDIPTRNQINRMIKDDPYGKISFHLIVWDWTEKSYRCAMVIKRKDDIGIYYTSEANYRLI